MRTYPWKGGVLALLYYKNDTEHIQTLYMQNTTLLNVKACGTHTYHCASKN